MSDCKETIDVMLPDGSSKEVAANATVRDVAAAIGSRLADAALAGKVGGILVDLSTPVKDGDVVEIVTAKSPEALDILRHSAAHIMAQAVKELFPDAQFGIGPSIADGFYYDFEVGRAFTPDDLAAIKERMAKIVAAKLPFIRREVSAAE
ncbi:MAG: TGS domain-containing protein, partial [Coriobacteriales bacterium]|nr:TGS domain-containing protein [Coriobacteriales bacterium]